MPLEAPVAAVDEDDDDCELVWFSLLANRLSFSVAMLPPPVVAGLVVLVALAAAVAEDDWLLTVDAVVLLAADRLAIGGKDSLWFLKNISRLLCNCKKKKSIQRDMINNDWITMNRNESQ